MPPKAPTRVATDEKNTNLRIKGSAVVQRVFKGKYSKAQMVKEMEKLQKQYKHKNLKCMIRVVIPEVGEWRSGKSFNLNGNILIPDDYHWDTADDFVVYFWKDTPPTGGNDDIHNDCFPNSIAKYIDYYRFPKDMKNAELFKKKFGLARDDPFPFRYVPEAEDYLKININIAGDYNYTSQHMHKETVNLLLTDGHYTPVIQSSGELLVGIPKMAHKLVVFFEGDDVVYCYDGVDEYTMTMKQYKKINNSKFKKGEICDTTYIKGTNRTTLKHDYDKLIRDVELVKELSYGKIDLSRSGFLPQNEALKSIHYAIQALDQGQPINAQEEIWIDNNKGGVRYIHDDVTIPEAYEYDIRGSFASQLSSKTFTFPINTGEFHYIDALPDIVPYGIYRCVIEETDDYKLNRLLRFSKDNYYTHFDINSARLLGMKITLIKDNQANALLYPKNRASGSVYFGAVTHRLNTLKMAVSKYEKDNNVADKDKNTIVKDIMACMYGSLCSKNKVYVSLHRPINIEGNKNIIDISKRMVAYTEVGNLFKYNFGRIGCFLTSACRLRMVKEILPIKDHVYRFMTDSILSDIPLENHLKVGENLGEFKPDKRNGKSATIFKNGRKTQWVD